MRPTLFAVPTPSAPVPCPPPSLPPPPAGFGVQLAIALVTEAAASPQGALIDAAVMASATDVSSMCCMVLAVRASQLQRRGGGQAAVQRGAPLPAHLPPAGRRVRPHSIMGLHRLGLHRAHRRCGRGALGTCSCHLPGHMWSTQRIADPPAVPSPARCAGWVVARFGLQAAFACFTVLVGLTLVPVALLPMEVLSAGKGGGAPAQRGTRDGSARLSCMGGSDAKLGQESGGGDGGPISVHVSGGSQTAAQEGGGRKQAPAAGRPLAKSWSISASLAASGATADTINSSRPAPISLVADCTTAGLASPQRPLLGAAERSDSPCPSPAILPAVAGGLGPCSTTSPLEISAAAGGKAALPTAGAGARAGGADEAPESVWQGIRGLLADLHVAAFLVLAFFMGIGNGAIGWVRPGGRWAGALCDGWGCSPSWRGVVWCGAVWHAGLLLCRAGSAPLVPPHSNGLQVPVSVPGRDRCAFQLVKIKHSQSATPEQQTPAVPARLPGASPDPAPRPLPCRRHRHAHGAVPVRQLRCRGAQLSCSLLALALHASKLCCELPHSLSHAASMLPAPPPPQVPVFFYSGRILERLGVERALHVAMGAYILRLCCYLVGRAGQAGRRRGGSGRRADGSCARWAEQARAALAAQHC